RRIVRLRIDRNQHAAVRQRLLQFSDRNIRGRGTVGLFDLPKQRLQSRVLVSYHPPARKHLSLVEARYPDDLAGTGKTGIEIIGGWHRHSITWVLIGYHGADG